MHWGFNLFIIFFIISYNFLYKYLKIELAEIGRRNCLRNNLSKDSEGSSPLFYNFYRLDGTGRHDSFKNYFSKQE